MEKLISGGDEGGGTSIGHSGVQEYTEAFPRS